MHKFVFAPVLVASLFGASIASAQSVLPMQSTGTGLSGTVSTPNAITVNLMTASGVSAGGTAGLLALIQLSGQTSTLSATVASLPVALGFNGVPPGAFTRCTIRNANNLGLALNTGVYAISSLGPSSALFTFDTPVVVPAGAVVNLALTCDVAPTAPLGGVVQVALNPGSVAAVDVTGAPIPVVAGAGATYGSVTVTAPGTGAAGTSTSSPASASRGTPGVPNTGAGGGAASTFALIALSALFALGGTYALGVRKAIR